MSVNLGAAVPQQKNSDIIASCIEDSAEIKKLEDQVKIAKNRKEVAEKVHAETVKKFGAKSRPAGESLKAVEDASRELEKLQQDVSDKKGAYQGKCGKTEENNPKDGKKEKADSKKSEEKPSAPKPEIKKFLKKFKPLPMEHFERRSTVVERLHVLQNPDFKKLLEKLKKDPAAVEKLLKEIEQPRGEMLLRTNPFEAPPKPPQEPTPTPVDPKKPTAPKEPPPKPVPVQ